MLLGEIGTSKRRSNYVVHVCLPADGFQHNEQLIFLNREIRNGENNFLLAETSSTFCCVSLSECVPFYHIVVSYELHCVYYILS